MKVTNNTLIIIDEVQESEEAYIFIKEFHDSSYENNLICSGSYVDNQVIQKNSRSH